MWKVICHLYLCYSLILLMEFWAVHTCTVWETQLWEICSHLNGEEIKVRGRGITPHDALPIRSHTRCPEPTQENHKYMYFLRYAVILLPALLHCQFLVVYCSSVFIIFCSVLPSLWPLPIACLAIPHLLLLSFFICFCKGFYQAFRPSEHN